MGKRVTEDGCGGEEKEKKPKAEVDVNMDLREKGLSVEEMHTRAMWRSDTSTPDRSGEMCSGIRMYLN